MTAKCQWLILGFLSFCISFGLIMYIATIWEDQLSKLEYRKLDNVGNKSDGVIYQLDSDIMRPYEIYHSYPDNIQQQKEVNYLKGKHKLIFWIASHCGLIREKIVIGLQKHVPVDVFGACKSRVLSNNQYQCQWSDKKCIESYKFYLSFENSFCEDYVSEKYWNPLTAGAVPIVIGGANYDSEVSIPGSYINALDFNSTKSLADYIKYLDTNDTAYNKYHEWRKLYTIQHHPMEYGMCAALNFKHPPYNSAKVYNDIDKFWGRKESCGRFQGKLNRLTL